MSEEWYLEKIEKYIRLVKIQNDSITKYLEKICETLKGIYKCLEQ